MEVKKIERKIEKDSIEWKMFKGLYAIFQKFGEPEERESYWEDLAKALTQFHETYPINAAKHFGIALGEYLEEEYKIRHEKGITKEP